MKNKSVNLNVCKKCKHLNERPYKYCTDFHCGIDRERVSWMRQPWQSVEEQYGPIIGTIFCKLKKWDRIKTMISKSFRPPAKCPYVLEHVVSRES